MYLYLYKLGPLKSERSENIFRRKYLVRNIFQYEKFSTKRIIYSRVNIQVNIYSTVNISRISSPKMEMNDIHLWRDRSLSFRLLLKQKKIETITRSFHSISDTLFLFVIFVFYCLQNLPNNYDFCTIFDLFLFCFRFYISFRIFIEYGNGFKKT